MDWLVPMQLMQWGAGRQGTLVQLEWQDWPWQPGGRQHAGDSSPSRTGRGDEVGEEEDGDSEGKRGRKSGGHLADPRCSCNSLWLGHWRW